jgi:membrane protein YqaA with SNARE-associated domain
MAATDKARRQLHRLAHSPRAQPLLVWLSFLEAIVLPIPLEAVLVPYMLLRRDLIWRIAGLALGGFLAASLVGYLIGDLAFATLGLPLIEAAGWQAAFADAKALFDRHGFWALVLIGLLPIPTQVAMLAGGAFGFPAALFVLAMGLSRGIRYFGLALLVLWLGPRAEAILARLDAMPRRRRWLIRVAACAAALGLAIAVIRLAG